MAVVRALDEFSERHDALPQIRRASGRSLTEGGRGRHLLQPERRTPRWTLGGDVKEQAVVASAVIRASLTPQHPSRGENGAGRGFAF
jgi:hypothetical protein